MMMERGRKTEGWGDYWGREKEGVFTAGWNLFFNTEIKRGSASERKHSLISEKADLKCIAAMCVYLDASICTSPLQERARLLHCM